MSKWEIWYSNDFIYEGSDIIMAPVLGVQVIVQFDDSRTNYYLQSGDNFYIWDYARWVGVDWWGLVTYLTKPGWKRVLLGETVPNEVFKKIKRRIQEKHGEKQNYLPGERR